MFQNIIIFISVLVFGAVIGAYYTTISYRIPHDQKLITSECYCTVCSAKLKTYMQIPVISYILLKGKCAYCHTDIPIRYPLIEAWYICFYLFTFLLMKEHPVILSVTWIITITLMLSGYLPKHLKGTIKGITIMLIYHIIFCIPLSIILLSRLPS